MVIPDPCWQNPNPFWLCASFSTVPACGLSDTGLFMTGLMAALGFFWNSFVAIPIYFLTLQAQAYPLVTFCLIMVAGFYIGYKLAESREVKSLI